MIRTKPLLMVVLMMTTLHQLHAQSDTTAAQIDPVINDNQVKFKSVLRPLRQIAGAPQAFYTYFWEFGDGTYSFEKEPLHYYKDTGIYQVRLYATNNYDDGKKPPTRPRPIPVRKREMMAANTKPAFFAGEGSLEIKTNQQPKPGEDMVLLIGYRNRPGSGAARASGSVMLLYNEKQFSQNSFDVADVRAYNSERRIGLDSLMAYAPVEEYLEPEQESRQGIFQVSAPGYLPPPDRQQLKQFLNQQMSGYRAHNIWRVNEVKQGEEKFMFISVNTLPEMIKDTNAVVTITGLYIPDDPALDVETFALELQIVASHDPNRIMLKRRRLSYRFTGKNRENIYKIQFQNTGKGPAKKVAITVTIPGMLNATTIDVVDMSPKCTWCDSARVGQSCIDTVITKDSIQFIFNNIYLPGTQQDGVGDPDSTKGYVRYKMRFGRKIKKIPFTSRAAIVFDKNEPVYTNRSVGRFRKGFSPGIFLGYNINVGDKLADISPTQYNIGFVVSEYAAYRKYFQFELHLQPGRQYDNLLGRRDGGDTILGGRLYLVDYRESYQRIKIFSAELVPLHFRYNFTSFLSGGVGGMVNVEVSKSERRYNVARLRSLNPPDTLMAEFLSGPRTDDWGSWRGGFFGDLQIGRVRAGPAAGVRFMQYFNPSHQRLVFYLTYKL
jgi:hypothetical protein